MFWPDQVLKDAVACLAVLVVVLLLVVQPVQMFSHEGPIDDGALGGRVGRTGRSVEPILGRAARVVFLVPVSVPQAVRRLGRTGRTAGRRRDSGWWHAGAVLDAAGRPLEPGASLQHWLFVAILAGRSRVSDRGRGQRRLSGPLDRSGTLRRTCADDRGRRQRTKPRSPRISRTIRSRCRTIAISLRAYENYRKSKEYLQAVDEANQEAQRITVLASAPAKIPPSGAITLLRNDAKTQGPKLFAQHCASCHTHVAARAEGDAAAPADAKASSAPNLYGFASRAWLAGLSRSQADRRAGVLRQHEPPRRYRWSALSTTRWRAGRPRKSQNVVLALSAEAGLKSQVEADRKDAERIEAGRKLIADGERCASCHKFHEHGELGSAPDLTGYGSREWLHGDDRQSQGRAILSRRQRPDAVVRRASGRLARQYARRPLAGPDRRLAARRVV